MVDSEKRGELFQTFQKAISGKKRCAWLEPPHGHCLNTNQDKFPSPTYIYRHQLLQWNSHMERSRGTVLGKAQGDSQERLYFL